MLRLIGISKLLFTVPYLGLAGFVTTCSVAFYVPILAERLLRLAYVDEKCVGAFWSSIQQLLVK